MSETSIKTGHQPVPHQRIIKGFTFKGKEVDVESLECFAKLVQLENGRTDYYVKVNVKHILFDPDDLEHTSALERKSRRTGNPVYSFTKISQNGFENYVAYLKNNGKTLYRLASRELLTHG